MSQAVGCDRSRSSSNRPVPPPPSAASTCSRGRAVGATWRNVPVGHDGEMEDAADRRAYGLGVVGVDAVADEHDALRSCGVGAADHRAGIARIADVGADDQERRTGRPAASRARRRGCGTARRRLGAGRCRRSTRRRRRSRRATARRRLWPRRPGRRAAPCRLGREDLDRRAGLGERLAYGLGAFGEELAGLGPERTSGEPPGVLHTS